MTRAMADSQGYHNWGNTLIGCPTRSINIVIDEYDTMMWAQQQKAAIVAQCQAAS